MAVTGCNWMVGKVKRWNSKARKYEMAPVFCHKLTAKDSDLCPKHQLFREYGEKEGTEPLAYATGR